MRLAKTTLLICVCLCVLLAVPVAFGGKKKRDKHVEKFPDVDLSEYSVLFVDDFEISDPKVSENPKREGKAKRAAKAIPDFLITVLPDDIFDEVVRGPMDGRQDAVALEVDITTYKPGSKTARFMMAGAGKAKLHFDVRLIEASTGKELIRFPVKRTWAWGGVMGGSKGIEDMDENAATELAMYLEESKRGG